MQRTSFDTASPDSATQSRKLGAISEGRDRGEARKMAFFSLGCGVIAAIIAGGVLFFNQVSFPRMIVYALLIGLVLAGACFKWLYGGSRRDDREAGYKPLQRRIAAGRRQFVSLTVVLGLSAVSLLPLGLRNNLGITSISEDFAFNAAMLGGAFLSRSVAPVRTNFVGIV